MRADMHVCMISFALFSELSPNLNYHYFKVSAISLIISLVQ